MPRVLPTSRGKGFRRALAPRRPDHAQPEHAALDRTMPRHERPHYAGPNPWPTRQSPTRPVYYQVGRSKLTGKSGTFRR
jgi:hypothetical protein